MTSSEPSTRPAPPLPDHATVASLYETNRFMDAYSATAEAWTQRDLADRLEPRDLVMAGRLARRLGGPRLSRWLLRLAAARAPDDPVVRYFSRWLHHARATLLDQIRMVEAEPDLPEADPTTRSSWLVDGATCYAAVRDFDRALAMIDHATELEPNSVWTYANRSIVLMFADRWDEGLADAETAWTLVPGRPASAHALSRALLHMGRVEEAATRLHEAGHAGQSWEVAALGINACAAAAEATTGETADTWCGRARDLSERLLALAPLADREMQTGLDHIRRDVGLLVNDHEELTRPAKSAPGGFFSIVRGNILANPEGQRHVYPYQPVRQKHNTCLPASVSAALSAFGETIDAEEFAARLTYGGTALWRAAEWLESAGYAVRHALYRPEVARELLGRGLPFVLCQSWDSGAHAMAAIGLDEAAGTLIVHDPGSDRRRYFLVDELHQDEEPLGPDMLVVVPADRQVEVDAVLPPGDVAAMSAVEAHARQLALAGRTAAADAVTPVTRDYPDHPVVRYLGGLHRAVAGDVAGAMEVFEALAGEHSRCVRLRHSLVDTYRRTGDTSRLRAALAEIVRQGRLPGVEGKQEWSYPPATYMTGYADLLSLSSEHTAEAKQLLRTALRNAPYDAEAYHVLADVLARGEEWDSSVLPSRIASLLSDDNDHYGRAAADALRRLGRAEEGLAFLQRRAIRLAGYDQAARAWITYIETTEDYGFPERAESTLRKILNDHDQPDFLLPFAVQFRARRGEWQEAEDALARLADSPLRLQHMATACDFHSRRGAWQRALEHAEGWLHEAPHDFDARRQFAALAANRDGEAATCRLIRQWLEEFPGHDSFEGLLLDWLDTINASAEGLALVRQRTVRNPHDSWAWREVAHRAENLVEMRRGDTAERRGAEALLEEAMAACQRTCPDNPATIFLLARREEAAGNPVAATELYLQGLRIDPEHGYGYSRIGELLPALPADRQEATLAALESTMLGAVGPLAMASSLADQLARLRGAAAAEAAVMRWRDARGKDPELLAAHANLLLVHGQGRRDAERAASLLDEAIHDFPSQIELRTLVARTHGALLREKDAEAAWRETLRRHPTMNRARYELAELLERGDDVEAARDLLREATRVAPLDSTAWRILADHLWEHGLPLEAMDTLTEALAKMPEDIGMRQAVTDRLLDLGRDEAAVEVSREGTRIHPDGAYCWHLYGAALTRSAHHTEHEEIEAAFRKALALNAELFDATDQLAMQLAHRRHFEEARRVVEESIPYLLDPCCALGRLAWLQRIEGKSKEAVEAMGKVLDDAPWYAWGWGRYLDWLADDESWDLAKRRLAAWPDALAGDASLRGDRLSLLQRAGAEVEQLDREWDELLHDFPQHARLHLVRFDQLWEAERKDEAKALLEKCLTFHATDRFVLARRVETLIDDRRRDEALDLAVQIWLTPSRDDTWSEGYTWRLIAEAKLARKAVRRIQQAVDDDYRPGVCVWELCVAAAVGCEPDDSAPLVGRFHPRLLFSLGLRRALRLLRSLDGVSWETAPHRAAACSMLQSGGYGHVVLREWRRNREAWLHQTSVWQQVGHAALQISRKRARAHLADWPTRPGIEMFIVSNYTIALRGADREGHRKDKLEEICAAASEALTRLQPDWTARYLACNLAEAALRLGRVQDFLAAMDAYRGFIDPPRDADGFYARDSYKYAPEVLLLFETLLRSDRTDRTELKAWTRQLKQASGLQPPKWIKRLWREHSRG